MTDVIELLRTARDHTENAPPLDLGVVQVRATTRRRRRRLAVAGTLGAVVVGAAALGTALPARDGVVAGDGTGIAAFDRVQELPDDALPSSAVFESMTSPAEPSSSRLVVNTADVHAWVFRLQDGQICVLAKPVTHPESSGATCQPLDEFRNDQLRLGLTDPTTVIEVVVAPVDRPPPENLDGLAPITDGVWVSFRYR